MAAAADGVAAQLTSIAEMRSRTLVERIKAIEALLPAQSERLRAQVCPWGGQAECHVRDPVPVGMVASLQGCTSRWGTLAGHAAAMGPHLHLFRRTCIGSGCSTYSPRWSVSDS